MKRLPQIALLPDGKRMHLQDGPIDLIIEAKGKEADVRAAYQAAARRFTGLLDELCEELVELRRAASPARCALKGVVARRMHEAVVPFAADHFITPMAAVAGSVAEEILGAMLGVARLDRAYVNNGGDIALHLTGGEQFTVGLMDRPDRHGLMRTMVVDAGDPTRGWRPADGMDGVSRLASPTPLPCSHERRRRPMRQPLLLPTPSICPGIPRSPVARPMNSRPTAISVHAWLPAMSAN